MQEELEKKEEEAKHAQEVALAEFEKAQKEMDGKWTEERPRQGRGREEEGSWDSSKSIIIVVVVTFFFLLCCCLLPSRAKERASASAA